MIAAVASYIRGAAKYNLRYDRRLDAEADVAVSFLESYREGICQHYATAATAMYRALGIPARYVVGYMGQTEAGESVSYTHLDVYKRQLVSFLTYEHGLGIEGILKESYEEEEKRRKEEESRRLAAVSYTHLATKVPENAFFGCHDIEQILLPAATDEIGAYAFARCTSLKTAPLGENLVKIGERAFYC